MWMVIACATLATIVLLRYMYSLAFMDQVKEEYLYFKEFPSDEEISLFFISDIHRRIIHDNIINQVIGKVDFVLIGGDLAEKGVPIEQIEENLLKLKRLGPIYFVWGNNDYEMETHDLDALFIRHGIKAIEDTSVLLETNDGGCISLMGIDYFDEEEGRGMLTQALEDSFPNSFKILASHTPKITTKIKDEHRINLVLSGHTHGGQIRIMGLGKYRLGGIDKINDTVVFTSNGYGTSLFPLRLGAKPESHLIHLNKDCRQQ